MLGKFMQSDTSTSLHCADLFMQNAGKKILGEKHCHFQENFTLG